MRESNKLNVRNNSLAIKFDLTYDHKQLTNLNEGYIIIGLLLSLGYQVQPYLSTIYLYNYIILIS